MWQKIISAFVETHPAIFIIEFIFLFALFYFIMSVLKKNNAELLNYIFIAFCVLTGAVFVFVEGVNNFLYIIFPIFYVLAMVVMFSTEIKRTIWNLSTKKMADSRHQDLSKDKNTTRECINEIIKALQNMSKNDIGALIILASSPMPNSILERDRKSVV